MGHDEDRNFNGEDAVQSSSASISVKDELNRISGATPQAQTSGGDIILNKSSKKNVKIVVIVIAATIFIVGGIIAATLIKNGNKSSGPVVNNTSASKTAFNNFYHYLVDKTDSDDDISAQDFEKFSAYLEKKPNDNNLNYLSVLDEKYQAFVGEYFKTVGKTNIEDVYPYYYGYFRIVLGASQINMNRIYKEEGLENTQKYIYEAVEPLGDASKTNTELDDYVKNRREELILKSNLMPYIDAAGCIDENFVTREGCSYIRDEYSIGIENQISNLMNIRKEIVDKMERRANRQMRDLYDEIYEINTEKGGVVE